MTAAHEIPYGDINDRILINYVDRLRRMFPNGKLRGKEFVVGNLDGDAGDSLSINVITGEWGDFAEGLTGGDPISLHAAKYCGGRQSLAARELGEELGLIDPIARTAKV